MQHVKLESSNENLIIEDMQKHLDENLQINSKLLVEMKIQLIKLKIKQVFDFRINYNSFAYIQPSEVKQYLFKLTYKDLEKEPKPLSVGKLDIHWKNSFGDTGHLQTHPLTKTVCDLKFN